MVSNVTSGSSICLFSLVLQMMLLETFTIEIRKDVFQVSGFQPDGILAVSLEGLDLGPRQNVLQPAYIRDSAMVLQDDSGRLATGTLVIYNSRTEQKQSVFTLGQGTGSFTKCFKILVASDLNSLNFILRIGFVASGNRFHRSSVVTGTAEGWRSTLPSLWWTDTTWRWEEEQPQLASSVSSD